MARPGGLIFKNRAAVKFRNYSRDLLQNSLNLSEKHRLANLGIILCLFNIFKIRNKIN